MEDREVYRLASSLFLIITIPLAIIVKIYINRKREGERTEWTTDFFTSTWYVTAIICSIWMFWKPVSNVFNLLEIITIKNTYVYPDSHWFCQVQPIALRVILVLLLAINVVGAFKAYKADKINEESEGNSARTLCLWHILIFLIPNWWIIWLIPTWI